MTGIARMTEMTGMARMCSKKLRMIEDDWDDRNAWDD